MRSYITMGVCSLLAAACMAPADSGGAVEEKPKAPETEDVFVKNMADGPRAVWDSQGRQIRVNSGETKGPITMTEANKNNLPGLVRLATDPNAEKDEAEGESGDGETVRKPRKRRS